MRDVLLVNQVYHVPFLSKAGNYTYELATQIYYKVFRHLLLASYPCRLQSSHVIKLLR